MMDFRKHAADISEAYKTNNKIASILIAGSVSRGWNDEHSDIEIYVLWKDEPSDEDRLAPIRQVGGQVMDFYPLEEDEWSETYTAGGVKFEMSHFLVSYLDEMIESVITTSDTDKDKQCLMAGIQDGIILYGEEAAIGLKGKVNSYPESIGKQVVLDNLELSSRWNSRYILADREDIYILHDVLNEAIGKVLEMLHGVNCMYIGHPKLKWLKQTVDKMKKVPSNFVERVRGIFREPDVSAIRDLENILLETYSMIEETYPEINIKEFRDKLLFTRPTRLKEIVIMEVALDIIVRSTEIDVNGHVNNAKYLEYIEWGREEWYERAGLAYDKFLEMGIQTVTVNININYRKECVQGDQLTIKTCPEKVGRTSYVLKQEIYNQNGDLCADALVTSVTMDADTRKSREVPDELRKLFNKE